MNGDFIALPGGRRADGTPDGGTWNMWRGMVLNWPGEERG
jgi:hypothetical protein